MARVADPQKRAEWVERLRRFETSRMTVEAFCAAEGVSTASFYQWRAKLAVGEKLATSAQHPAAFVPVHVAATSEVAIHLPGGVQVTLPAHERELIERTIAVLVGATAAQERH
jgi:transposase-like protein